MILKKIFLTDRATTTILIRLMIGAVFLSEGIQKFLFPDIRGAGRFEKIGLPQPELLGAVVGGMEVVGGALILIGCMTRLAAVPLIIIMLVAICTTKLEILSDEGIWSMLHSTRTDWAMLLGSIFLLIRGGGKWSVDFAVSNRTEIDARQ